MKRYRYEIDNVRSHLRSLWAVIVLQLVVIVGRAHAPAIDSNRAHPAGFKQWCQPRL